MRAMKELMLCPPLPPCSRPAADAEKPPPVALLFGNRSPLSIGGSAIELSETKKPSRANRPRSAAVSRG